MIAYKYVIKRLDQYYPLINYGIDRYPRNAPRYKLNETYNNPIDLKTTREGVGYHFFTEPLPKCHGSNNVKNWWERFLKKRLKKDIKITILKCYVEDFQITKGGGYEKRIIANKFKTLEELNDKN